VCGQRAWISRPIGGQVGADVTFQDRLVVGDAVAQVADASDIRMDGFPDGSWMAREHAAEPR
jgi:hypothetical protein